MVSGLAVLIWFVMLLVSRCRVVELAHSNLYPAVTSEPETYSCVIAGARRMLPEK